MYKVFYLLQCGVLVSMYGYRRRWSDIHVRDGIFLRGTNAEDGGPGYRKVTV